MALFYDQPGEVDYNWPIRVWIDTDGYTCRWRFDDADRLREWRTHFVVGIDYRREIWERLHAKPVKRSVVGRLATWAKLAWRWFAPLLVLAFVSLVAPSLTTLVLAVALIPVQVIVWVNGALKLYDWVVMTAAYLVQQRILEGLEKEKEGIDKAMAMIEAEMEARGELDISYNERDEVIYLVEDANIDYEVR